MPKRTSNQPPDVNVTAFQIMEAATSLNKQPAGKKLRKKNPAAVALGRLGGLKGGQARADKLSAKKRSQIAQKAAPARFK